MEKTGTMSEIIVVEYLLNEFPEIAINDRRVNEKRSDKTNRIVSNIHQYCKKQLEVAHNKFVSQLKTSDT